LLEEAVDVLNMIGPREVEVAEGHLGRREAVDVLNMILRQVEMG
jgi:hypothetical protein